MAYINNGKMRIALPNKGALRQPALVLLSQAGYAALYSPKETLCARCEDERIEYLFVRAQDVGKYVASGASYAGITGEDVLLEDSLEVRKELMLGFGACEIALAVPENSSTLNVNDLEGKRIATKLPNISRKFLSENNVNAKLFELSGATEIAPSTNLADAIIDHVQTGRTLKANRLKKIQTIAKSEACLIATNEVDEKKEELLSEISLSIAGAIKAKGLRYLMLNATSDLILSEVLKVLPSMESPTVLPLAKKGEYAIQTVVPATKISSVIRQASLAGGKDILVMPLEKVI